MKPFGVLSCLLLASGTAAAQERPNPAKLIAMQQEAMTP